MNNISSLIGNTPIVKCSRLFSSLNNVFLKLEHLNPGGSIKDRIALAMIEDAEQKGVLRHGVEIIEPTSGNTGIGLAMIAASRGYSLSIVMPESMSLERRQILQGYGAKLVLTPAAEGMKGAIEKANQLMHENAWMPLQFENPANPLIHEKTTAVEILHSMPQGVDYLFAGVGTGGHISGVGRVLKKHFPNMKIVAVEPAASAVISGRPSGPHAIQGIGAGFIPKNLDVTIIDHIVCVENENAKNSMRSLALSEGVFAGISSGAVVDAINQFIAQNKLKNQTILGFTYDRGERYLSV
jgi:cysteine synthase